MQFGFPPGQGGKPNYGRSQQIQYLS
jgi:hypothetical protein